MVNPRPDMLVRPDQSPDQPSGRGKARFGEVCCEFTSEVDCRRGEAAARTRAQDEMDGETDGETT
jgi:hypothetical protein